jgi:subtilisin-like proprotein convertase family protein
MKASAIAVLTLLLIGATPLVSLAEKPSNEDPGAPDSPGNCSVQGYKCTRSPQLNLDIPDDDPAGVFTDCIVVVPPGPDPIVDVVVSIEFSHTYIGDMNVQLFYDPGDGSPLLGPVSLMCRQQVPGCPLDASMGFGCSGDLLQGGRYVFGTVGATKEIAAAGQCPSVLPFGCYREASESSNPLSVFNGASKNGCWFLHLQDGAGADLGVLYNWEVCLLNDGATPVEASTWGAIKATYND